MTDTPFDRYETSIIRFMAKQHGKDPERLSEDEAENFLADYEDSEEWQAQYRAGVV